MLAGSIRLVKLELGALGLELGLESGALGLELGLEPGALGLQLGLEPGALGCLQLFLKNGHAAG